MHGGTPEAFVSCGVAPPRKKRTRGEVQAEKAAKAVEKAEKKAVKAGPPTKKQLSYLSSADALVANVGIPD